MNLFQTAAAPEPLSLLTMLGGGLLAFVSPCVLPMLPVYAMYLMGGEKERGTRLLVLRRCRFLCLTIPRLCLDGLGIVLQRITAALLDAAHGQILLGIRPVLDRLMRVRIFTAGHRNDRVKSLLLQSLCPLCGGISRGVCCLLLLCTAHLGIFGIFLRSLAFCALCTARGIRRLLI